MGFEQQVMGEINTTYQMLLRGTASAPWSKDVSILESNAYAQKRDDFYNRLSQERLAFNAAVKEIITSRDERLISERKNKLSKKQQKKLEKAQIYCNVYDAYVLDGGGFNLSFLKYKKYSEQYIKKLESKFWS